jgi:hypothetical protein
MPGGARDGGQVTIGMLEYWNDGIMGSEEMRQWFVVQNSNDVENDNLIEKEFPFNPPKYNGRLKSTFQYSIIPLFRVRSKASTLTNYD